MRHESEKVIKIAMRRLIALGVMLSALSTGCVSHFFQERPNPGSIGLTSVSQEKPLPEWIGKKPSDLVEKMGEPKMAVPMESGAEELYYSYDGHRYYFETDLKGRIQTAVRID